MSWSTALTAPLWLPSYTRSCLQRHRCGPGTRVWLTIADHFEPYWAGASRETARGRVSRWRRRWPEIAARHRDAAGRPAKYSFFYPEEEYRPELLEPLAEMAHNGIADVEVHLHHDGEGEQNFVDRISRFTELLFSRHNLLRKPNGRIAFGFIHGNWALDNSHPDGRHCGLNNELSLLRQLGCYADFTLPSAPSPTQARMVNVIYWATDDPERPKSHDTGVPVRPGEPATGDLMLIPGPLGLKRRETGFWFVPRLETGELASNDVPSRHRARRWLDLAPCIGGDLFLKLFTHGTQEENSAALLGGHLDSTFQHLQAECNARGYCLYFVSAWEMYQAVEALRRGEDPAEGLQPLVPPEMASTSLANPVAGSAA